MTLREILETLDGCGLVITDEELINKTLKVCFDISLEAEVRGEAK